MPKKKTPATSVPAENAQSSSDAPALPPSTQAVLSQLDAENGMTAAEVAESVGLGRSTVTKALSTLHEAGLAVRQDGGHEGTRRIADRWFAASGAIAAPAADHDTDDHTPDLPPETGDDGGLATAAEPAPEEAEDRKTEPEPAGEHTGADAADDGPAKPTTNAAPGDEAEATVPAAAPAGAEHTEPASGGEIGQATASDALSDTAEHDDQSAPLAAEPGRDSDCGAETEEAAPIVGAEPGPARLGKGELRAQVADHLRDHPDRAWTPSAIAKILGRSAGAINNACEKLLETEAVTTFDDKPRRFQWRGDQDAPAICVGSAVPLAAKATRWQCRSNERRSLTVDGSEGLRCGSSEPDRVLTGCLVCRHFDLYLAVFVRGAYRPGYGDTGFCQGVAGVRESGRVGSVRRRVRWRDSFRGCAGGGVRRVGALARGPIGSRPAPLLGQLRLGHYRRPCGL